MPAKVIKQWERELSHEEDQVRIRKIAQMVNTYCDKGYGECQLKDPRVARLAQEQLFENHGKQYELHAWVVMPNHMHVLLTPIGAGLEEIVKGIKGASSVKINQLLGRSGRLWQPGFFDRYIRDGDHLAGVKSYIEWNPVKATLCSDPTKWAWGSANPDSRARLEFLISSRELTSTTRD